MFANLMRAFRPMDTSAVDAAIAEAGAAHHDVRVRARALRMDVGCGDPVGRMRTMADVLRARGGAVLRELYGSTAREPLPDSLQQLLDRI